MFRFGVLSHLLGWRRKTPPGANRVKVSLNFSQKDIDDIKYKLYITEEKVWDAEDAIYGNQCAIDKLVDQNEQPENHSRRNNVKVIGIPEKDPNESWEML